MSTAQGYMVDYSLSIPGSDVTFAMVAIPGGHTAIGSRPEQPDHRSDEQPRVVVNVAPFWIGKFEVTWSEYRQYMDLTSVFEHFSEHGIRPVTAANSIDAITAPSKLYDPSFTLAAGDAPRQPAVSMSQYAAKQYTKWLSLITGEFYRLPSEIEWEHACRAGHEDLAYAYGDDAQVLADHAWFEQNSEGRTHEVGKKRPNDWGLHDMHGNVAEWVLDAYHSTAYADLAQTGTAGGPAIRWPQRLYPRVLRGGSWSDPAAGCRCASREPSDDDLWRSYDPNSPQSPWWFASDESQDVGFRILRPLVAPPRDQWNKYWDADTAAIQRVVDHRIDNEGRGERGWVDPELPAAIQRREAAGD